MLYDQKENCFLIGSDNFHVPLCLFETSHILCLEVNIMPIATSRSSEGQHFKKKQLVFYIDFKTAKISKVISYTTIYICCTRMQSSKNLISFEIAYMYKGFADHKVE